jgi:F-type H+-transporting ATPase subunit b
MKILFSIRKRSSTIPLIFLLVLLFAGVSFASSGGEEHGGKGWVATDTYRVMNFAVLAIALFFVLKKPATQALNARISSIENQLKELDERKSEAEKKLAEYNEKLATLDQEAGKIVQTYIKQGEEAKTRILEEAKAAAVKLEEQAQRNIEHEFKQAKIALQQDILEKAIGKAEEIITEKITDEDQDRLIGEYLDKVVAS